MMPPFNPQAAPTPDELMTFQQWLAGADLPPELAEWESASAQAIEQAAVAAALAADTMSGDGPLRALPPLPAADQEALNNMTMAESRALADERKSDRDTEAIWQETMSGLPPERWDVDQPNEPQDRETLFYPTTIRRYIRELIGPLPWVRRLFPCTVTEVDRPTRTCTVVFAERDDPLAGCAYYENQPKVGGEYVLRWPAKLPDDPNVPAQPRLYGRPWIKVESNLMLYAWAYVNDFTAQVLFRLPWPPTDPTIPAAMLEVVEVVQPATPAIPGLARGQIDSAGRLWIATAAGYVAYADDGLGTGALPVAPPTPTSPLSWVVVDAEANGLMVLGPPGLREPVTDMQTQDVYRRYGAGAWVRVAADVVGGEQGANLLWTDPDGGTHWAVWNDADDDYSADPFANPVLVHHSGYWLKDGARLELPRVQLGEHEETWQFMAVAGWEGSVIKRCIATKRVRDYDPWPQVRDQRIQYWLIEDPETGPTLTLLADRVEIANFVHGTTIASSIWGVDPGSELGAVNRWASTYDALNIWAYSDVAKVAHYSEDGGRTWAPSLWPASGSAFTPAPPLPPGGLSGAALFIAEL